MEGSDKTLVNFEGADIRRHWDREAEKWYFSVVDIVAAITGSTIPKRYWADLKSKLNEEGFQLYEKIVQLKFVAADGKKYGTDCADVEFIFRIIQSIPSPKAEPIKQWLAQVGYERLEEANDPEKAIDRAITTYARKGYSPEWINQRLKAIEVRKELTQEWSERGIKGGKEFATLTDVLTHAWSGMKSVTLRTQEGLLLVVRGNRLKMLRENLLFLQRII